MLVDDHERRAVDALRIDAESGGVAADEARLPRDEGADVADTLATLRRAPERRTERLRLVRGPGLDLTHRHGIPARDGRPGAPPPGGGRSWRAARRGCRARGAPPPPAAPPRRRPRRRARRR